MTTEEPTRERKERVLHTRISQQLAEDIRALAEDLRVPVSNLVRNVLEEAFDAVERVSGDVGGLVDDVLEEAGLATERYRRFRSRARARAAAARESERSHEDAPASGDPLARVVAWQPVVLAAPRRCARTGRELRPGERAYLGLGDDGPLGIYVEESALDLAD